MTNSTNNPPSVYHKGGIYQEINSDLFTSYTKVEDIKEVDTLVPQWRGKKIPLAMWKSILAFMKQSYDKFKSETLIFLYYDENNKDNPWSFWVPPQETNGMTVKSSPDNPTFQSQRALFPDTMFGTVHHHCGTSAFQSGTDEADEVKREGLHFTVGKLNNVDNIDVHFRMTLAGAHADLPAGLYIEMEETPFKKTCRVPKAIQDQARRELHSLDIKALPDDWETQDFSTAMENVTERKYTYGKAWSNSGTGGTYGYNQQTSLGWSHDYDDMYFKKNSAEHPAKDESPEDNSESFLTPVEPLADFLTPIESLADDFVTAAMTDYVYEDILNIYYTFISDYEKVASLYQGTLCESVIATDLEAMLQNTEFKSQPDYVTISRTIDKFLAEQSAQCTLDFCKQDLLHGLQAIQYEEGSGVQHMDKENVL